MSTLVHSSRPPMSLYWQHQQHQQQQHHQHHQHSGILLNGYPSPHPTQGRHSPSTPIPPSRIRFAPLPDPRNSSTSDDEKKQRMPPKLIFANGEMLSSRSLSDKLPSPSPSSSTGHTEDTTDRDEGCSTTSPQSATRKKTFFKHLLGGSASPIPDASPLGLGLFRSGSGDSNASSSDAGSSLCGDSPASIPDNTKRKRWASTSVPSINSFPFTSSSNNNNKSRSYSSSSDTRPHASNLPGIPLDRTRTQPSRPTISAPAESPIKLLNGRVYGKAQQNNPHTKQRSPTDWAEPEFVEWGYGGMGSVKSGEAFYGGVQRGNCAMTDADDDFEASGMGWVKRRREKREREIREAKEKEERERKQTDLQRSIEMRNENREPPSSGGGSPRSDDGAELPPKIVVHTTDPEHYRTVTTVPHASHSRHPSRNNSQISTATTSSISSNTTITYANSMTKRPSPLSMTHIRPSTADGDAEPERLSPVSTSSSRSSEESSPRGDDEEEDDEEEERRDGNRATSLCAGNEKISRRRE